MANNNIYSRVFTVPRKINVLISNKIKYTGQNRGYILISMNYSGKMPLRTSLNLSKMKRDKRDYYEVLEEE
jgi:hypothetical protein